MNRQELVSSIKRVLPGIAKKDIVQQFTCVNFFGSEIIATDGRLFIRAVMKEDSGINLSVPGRTLYSILDSLPCTEVMLREHKGKLKISGEGVKGTLLAPEFDSSQSVDKIVSEPSPDDYEKVPEGLIRAMRLCKFSCSSDQTMGALCGVHFQNALAVSCDRFRISGCTISDGVKEPFTVPVALITELEKHESGVEGYCIANRIVFFRLYGGQLTVASALIVGTFPDKVISTLDEVTPDKGLASVVVKLPEGMRDALKRQCVVQDDELDVDKETTVSLTQHGATLFSKSKTVGELEEEIAFEVPEEMRDVNFLINPIFFRDVLELCHEMTYLKDMGAIVFRGNNLTHLVRTRDN